MSDPNFVATSPERVWPLLNGVTTPAVSVQSPDGAAFDLTAAVKVRPTVLVFYRGGW
jgi:hypothetical protein